MKQKRQIDTAVMTPEDNLLKMLSQYSNALDKDVVLQACAYAKEKHEGQTRASGEPYYTHPVEVAMILADMQLDQDTIVTAILHDTVEDTSATLDELEKLFGKNVATLVNGVSKLTRIESQTKEGAQGENFRKLVLAMSEDIRVLLIKLADRLHNMRTLKHFKGRPDKQVRIARETLEIYAPLAERTGLHKIKEELEDISFGYMNEEALETITNRLSFLRKEGGELVKTIIENLEKILSESNISKNPS